VRSEHGLHGSHIPKSAVAFTIEALLRILLWRTENLDGREPLG